MDAPLHCHATLPDSCAPGDPAVIIPPETSSSRIIDGQQPTSNRRTKKKKQTLVSDNASLDSSSNCSSAASSSKKGIKIPRNPKRIIVGPLTGPRNVRLSDVDALGLHLGMPIAAVVARGSKSWWMPNAVSTYNSGLQLLRCQIQVFRHMLFVVVIMIAAIAFLLIQRSSSSHLTMPVTVILLLLGVGCGCAGKFCIDTLGGRGNRCVAASSGHSCCSSSHSSSGSSTAPLPGHR